MQLCARRCGRFLDCSTACLRRCVASLGRRTRSRSFSPVVLTLFNVCVGSCEVKTSFIFVILYYPAPTLRAPPLLSLLVSERQRDGRRCGYEDDWLTYVRLGSACSGRLGDGKVRAKVGLCCGV